MTEFETNPNPIPPELVTPPVTPTYIPKRQAPILPIFFGFLIVITIAAAMGIAYYKTKLTASVTASPSPTAVSTPTPTPSVDPTATPSGSPKSSVKASAKPVSSTVPKSSSKPSSTPAPTPTPTATPFSQPTLDIRFGNPSAHIKQTYDDGSGAGRVINREYASIQNGSFDEVQSGWSPRVTVCYHIVSNEEIKGSDVKFILTLDDKTEVEDNLGGYDKLEAGRIYDWCHDTTSSIGSHTSRLVLNGGKSLKESNYTNGSARIDWVNLADNIAPNFTLMGPNNEGESGTCVFPQYVSDNVSLYANLKIEQKVDSGDWTKFEGNRYCFKGDTGSSHTYTSRITDERGNSSQQTKTFVLF